MSAYVICEEIGQRVHVADSVKAKLQRAVEQGQIHGNDGAAVVWEEVVDFEGDVVLDRSAFEAFEALWWRNWS